MKPYKILLLAFALLRCYSVSAQWVQTNGLYGGYISSFEVQDSVLFAGTNNGVLQSTDNGISWKLYNTGLADMNSAGSAFAVSDNYLFMGSGANGVFVSTDNGKSWAPANTGLANKYISSLAVNGNILFAGTVNVGQGVDGGVFLSTNNGASWTPVNSGLTNTFINSLAVSGTNLFAGTDGGVFLSTNNGQSWTAVNNGLTNTIIFTLAISGTNLFAAGEGGVFLSTNNGESWTAVNVGLPDFTEIYSLAVSGTDLIAGTISFSNEAGVYLSTNNGESWTAADLGLTLNGHNFIRAVAINGTNLFAGTTTSGIYRSSTNGSVWEEANTDNPISVHTLAANDNTLFAGTYSGVFRSTDNGVNWKAENTGLELFWKESSVDVLTAGGTDLFAGVSGQGIYRSYDNGLNWTLGCYFYYEYTSNYALAVSGNKLYAGTNHGMYLFTDNGNSVMDRKEINTGLNGIVLSIAVNDQNVYAGTSDGIYLLSDNDTSWTGINSSLTHTPITALAVNGTNLFAATHDKGIFLTANNGISWTAVNTGLTNTNINTLIMIGTSIFAATDNGVFLSTNNGSSWTPINDGLDSESMRIYKFAVNGTNLFAGTDNGIWRRPLSELALSAGKLIAEQPSNINLNQNYPNPFTDNTSINFSLAEKGFVSMDVYDINGQVVRKLASATYQSGTSAVEWKGDDAQGKPVKPGIFLCRMTVGDYSKAIRMIVR